MQESYTKVIQSQGSDSSSMYDGIADAEILRPLPLLPWQTPLNRFQNLFLHWFKTASFWCILWLGLFRVCPVVVVVLLVVLLYHHHELHARAASAGFAYRKKGLGYGRGGLGGEGPKCRQHSDGYKLSCMCLSLFLLSYCILFKFPTVRFLRLYRRHRFAIRNRNQLEGNSGE